MSYDCDCCGIKFNRLSNFKRHCETDKHKINYENKNKHKCDRCNKVFSSRQNLWKHQNKVCTDDKFDIFAYADDLKLEIVKKDMEIVKKDMENKLLLKDMEIKLRDQKIESLVKNNESLEKDKDNYKSIAKSSLSVLKYVTKYYPNAPALIGIEAGQPQKLLENKLNPNKDVTAQILRLHKDNQLCDVITDIIIALYYKKDPCSQQFWTSDHSRLNFVMVKSVNDVSKWVSDRNAVTIREKIVKPMLYHIKEMVIDYNLETSRSLPDGSKKTLDELQIDKTLVSDLLSVGTTQKLCMEVIDNIDKDIYTSMIIKKLAAKFVIKNDANTDIVLVDQSEKQKRKAYKPKHIDKTKKKNYMAPQDKLDKIEKKMSEIAVEKHKAIQQDIDPFLDSNYDPEEEGRKAYRELRKKRIKEGNFIKTFESGSEFESDTDK